MKPEIKILCSRCHTESRLVAGQFRLSEARAKYEANGWLKLRIAADDELRGVCPRCFRTKGEPMFQFTKNDVAISLAATAAAWMGSAEEAVELARNVANSAEALEDHEKEIEEAIRHRMVNGWATCGDVRACAAAMATVCRRFTRKLVAA